MAVEVLFRSLGSRTLHPSTTSTLISTLATTDASEAQIFSASSFLEGVYGDGIAERMASRAPTPMTVGKAPAFGSLDPTYPTRPTSRGLRGQWSILGLGGFLSPREENLPSTRPLNPPLSHSTGIGSLEKGPLTFPSLLPFWNTPRITRSVAKLRFGNLKENGHTPSVPRKHLPQRPSALPQLPDIGDISVDVDSEADFAILVSMYEVYNDRIFDLLANTRNPKDLRRRPLLFKSTEASADRKVVAGLRKIVCGNYEEALMVLETGLMERRVAGTGSNSVSSRSHGFFCVEVRKKRAVADSHWSSSQMTIVDLAGEWFVTYLDSALTMRCTGSERARNAKTAGATLAEAGKINESLMYLGQCLQMQSDGHDGIKVRVSLTGSTAAVMTYHDLAVDGTLPPMQADRTTLLQLLSLQPQPPLNPSSQSSTSHHDRHRRSRRRLQRDVSDPPLLRTSTRSYSPTHSFHHQHNLLRNHRCR